MSLSRALSKRCNDVCELCGGEEGLQAYVVAPKSGDSIDEQVVVCQTCHTQLADDGQIEANHWRCLNDSIWHEVDAVKVVSYRMLHKLQDQGWAEDLIEMMYMEEDVTEWARHGMIDPDSAVIHKDSNGNVLQSGDTVVLIKDLNVKGASFTAKRGTAVRRISLVQDNANHIQGRINDQTIIILTKYVKKS